MTQDIVVTIVHRGKAGAERMIRLRSRSNRPADPSAQDEAADSGQPSLPHEIKRHVIDFLVSQDSDGTQREKLLANPDVFQYGGSVILRPLAPKARKVPTGCAVGALPGGLGDAVPPLRFARDGDLTLDMTAEALVSYGIKRSEAQFLVLYVSDIVDDSLATGQPRSLSVSLDQNNVVARVERTASDDKDPNQLRVLIVIADHAAAMARPKPKAPAAAAGAPGAAKRPAQPTSASAA